VDQQRGGRLEETAGSLVPKGQLDHEPVQGQDAERADDAARDRVVVADHGVLHHVGDGEQHDQVERRELADLPLVAEAEREEQEHVDGGRPQDFLEHREVGDKHALHGSLLGREG
jgi:hypothetical protein